MDAWLGSLIGGVAGGVIGHFTNHAIVWFKENKQSSPERRFICVEIVFLLESYSRKCAEVVNDDGEPTDPHGELTPVVLLPDVIDYSVIKGNWRALKSETMYGICSLPPLQRRAVDNISFMSEMSSLPDNREYFDERQLQFAQLGLKAAKLACEIRKENLFPESDLKTWVIPTMQEKISQITSKRERYKVDEEL
ncbi:hypothetical protein [Franconibacter helveticus]|uniref:hypothetical protein n=1 Tax=Franconibacter helveticus TaxID=357240 RepID=UPI000496F668|nr:hypothetical protein [Franconibacter helveticus]